MEQAHQDIELFRNIFRHYAAERYEDEEIRKMVLYPSVTMLEDLDGESVSGSLRAKERSLRSARASDLYINSLLDKFESINDPLSHEEPTTIVLFPGVLGEFIDNRPFEKILGAKTTFRQTVNRALKGKRSEVFYLSSMKYQAVELIEAY